MERWCPNISQCPNVTSNISVSVQQVVCCKLVQLVTTEASDLDVAQTQLITTNTKKLWAYPQTKELRPTLNSPELSDSEVVITVWSELWTLSHLFMKSWLVPRPGSGTVCLQRNVKLSKLKPRALTYVPGFTYNSLYMLKFIRNNNENCTCEGKREMMQIYNLKLKIIVRKIVISNSNKDLILRKSVN